MASTASSYAQNVIKGVVMDVSDNPLPGVSVMVKGTNTGTTTDLDGCYSISAPKNGTLVPDFITFLRHHIAHIENQLITPNNWVVLGGALTKSGNRNLDVICSIYFCGRNHYGMVFEWLTVKNVVLVPLSA